LVIVDATYVFPEEVFYSFIFPLAWGQAMVQAQGSLMNTRIMHLVNAIGYGLLGKCVL